MEKRLTRSIRKKKEAKYKNIMEFTWKEVGVPGNWCGKIEGDNGGLSKFRSENSKCCNSQ